MATSNPTNTVTASAEPIKGGAKLNSQTDMSKLLLDIHKFVCSDMRVDGVDVPRFGVVSLLARRTPFYAYDNPEFIKRIGCKSAFTDGTHVFFNADFLRKALDQEREAKAAGKKEKAVIPIVLHELFHILYRHHYRLRDYDPDTRNVAMDLSINTRMRRSWPDLQFTSLWNKAWGMKEGDVEKYAHLSEETIAQMVVAERKQQQQQQQQQGQGQGQGQQGQDDQDQQSGGSSSSPSGGRRKGSKSSGGKGKPSPGQEGSPGDNSHGGVGDDEGDGMSENHVVDIRDVAKALTESGLDHAVDLLRIPRDPQGMKAHEKERELKIVDDIQRASQQARMLGGKFPGKHSLDCAEEMISNLFKPKLGFKNTIREVVCGEGMRYAYSIDVPDDLYYYDPTDMGFGTDDQIYTGTLIPARPNSAVLVLVDTSGSVNHDMLRLFYSEIVGMVVDHQNNIPKVLIWSADTDLKGPPETIDAWDAGLESRDFTVYGRGGTDIERSLVTALGSEYLEKEKIRAVLYFTDLFDAPPKRENLPEDLPPIVFVAPPDHRNETFARAVSDFAEVVEIDEGVVVDLETPPGMSP